MFPLDRKNCENIHGKPSDLAYNAASFVWCPEIGAKVAVAQNFIFVGVFVFDILCVHSRYLCCVFSFLYINVYK